jgi:cyclophilin family peptidyl-prolyl cis-trans isomerase
MSIRRITWYGTVAMVCLVALSALPGSRPEAKSGSRHGKKETAKMDPAIAKTQEYIAGQAIDKESPSWRTSLPKFPELAFTGGATYLWNLETSKGAIKVRLMPDVAPNHVANYLYLTELGFFDGLVFHRVIPGFMAQGGCPRGDGRGGPGYEFDGEFSPSVRHDRPGLLSMANAGPGTDGSQFFLTFVETPWLDGKHSIFGEVVEGMDTVKELEKYGSRSGQTSEKLAIDRATIAVE